MTDYIPHDSETIMKMLKRIGIRNIDELFVDIPLEIKLRNGLNLDAPRSEMELFRYMRSFADKNHRYSTVFRGGGSYFHYIPAIVDHILGRSEFYTSYTPYQAEVSQGMLQAIYEYQTLISHLTKMDVTNASMYDGATAFAEAAITASFQTRKRRILLMDDVHPFYKQVVETYCWGRNLELIIVSDENYRSELDEETAALMVQSPNFFGTIKDLAEYRETINQKNPSILLIQSMMDPTALGILKSPGDYNIDIFTAEGQSFGNPPSFGGPGLGIFTAKKKILRKIPGRLVGKTKELYGDNEGFILTLQTREQHIRRERATSNICSNQSLTMLASLIYLSALGRSGLKKVATLNVQKSNYLKKKLGNIKNCRVIEQGPTYNEFVFSVDDSKSLLDRFEHYDVLGPLDLSLFYPERENQLLVCVTELNTSRDILKFLKIVKEGVK